MPDNDSESTPGTPRPKREFVQKMSTAEARNWDFVAARPPGKTTNVLESIGHLVKGCLGGGVVAMHESFKMLGLWPAFIISILLGVLVSYCMYILVKSVQKIYGRIQMTKISYPDLAEATISIGPFLKLRKYRKVLRYAVDTTIAVDLFGACCVYMVVMGRTVLQLVYGMEEKIDNNLLRIHILYFLIPCILLSWVLELKYLAPFSIVGDIFLFIVGASTIYYGVKTHKNSPFDLTAFPLFKSVGGLFLFMGACVFSMEGIGVSIVIENHMTEPRKFPIVLTGGMSIVILMVVTVGFFGYWGYGDDAKSPVTMNFPFSPYSITLKVFMALMTFLTFGINFWVPFDLAYFYIRRHHPAEKNWFWERFYRALFVIAITLIAVAFPDVSAFIGLLGAFCLSNMGFIYPAFIELCLDWEDPGLGRFKWRLVKAVSIMSFGVILLIVGSYSSATQLVKNVYGKEKSQNIIL